ncbi:hypothetical protein EX30DRAFT_365285 [Ascodesmis nigricans]|uniref:Uncharacterized protein n=1 Tax=Ascodesmis nigricans TaxID=341454 RepID=A0A4S2MSQ6_9PEZI|nr:hypothetical protein EX30DRAFT_365285 [Ascodesmis nigricans]
MTPNTRISILFALFALMALLLFAEPAEATTVTNTTTNGTAIASPSPSPSSQDSAANTLTSTAAMFGALLAHHRRASSYPPNGRTVTGSRPFLINHALFIRMSASRHIAAYPSFCDNCFDSPKDYSSISSSSSSF